MPAKPASDPRTRWITRSVHYVGLATGLFTIYVYSAFLVHNRITHIQEVDSQAYFLMAKSFAHFQLPHWADDFAQFHGHPYIDAPDGATMAKYSPGWPLLLAIGYRINGHTGAMWVNTILGIAAALALFLLALEWMTSPAAFICIYLYLFSPMIAAYTAYPLAHSTDIAVTALAFWSTVRWAKTSRPIYSALAGFTIAYMPLTCAPLILIWPAIALAYILHRYFFPVLSPLPRPALSPLHAPLLSPLPSPILSPLPVPLLSPLPVPRGRAREGVEPQATPSLSDSTTNPTANPSSKSLRILSHLLLNHPALTLFSISFLLPTLFLATYNWLSFGRPWWTGYHLTGEQSAFDFTHFPDRLVEMFQSRQSLLPDSVWLLGVAGICLRVRRSAIAWILALWLLPIFYLYSGYYFHPAGPVYWRFLLPALPAVIFAIGLFVDTLAHISATLAHKIRRKTLDQPQPIAYPIATLIVVLALAFALHCNPLHLFEAERRIAAQRQQNESHWQQSLTDPDNLGAPAMLFTIAIPPLSPNLPQFFHGPTAVYSTANIVWDASTFPNVDAYDITTWRDDDYFRPIEPHTTPPKLWEILTDPNRDARLHALYQSIGRDAMPTNFTTHIKTSLAAGKTVLLVAPDTDISLNWIRHDPTLEIQRLEPQPNENTSFTIWRIAQSK